MRDPILSKLVESGIFPNDSNAMYALTVLDNLRQPISNPLLDVLGERNYTLREFSQYLVDHCGVKLGNIRTAIELLSVKDDLSELCKKVESIKKSGKSKETSGIRGIRVYVSP